MSTDWAAALPRIHEATELAWLWHVGRTRKGRTTPYVSHLLQVEGLVLDSGGSPDQAIAALLHDCLEDADSPAERATRELEIETRFGPAVLRMVLDLTDTTPDEAGSDKGPWRTRKERYLEQLRAAEPDSLLVAACDKRHNLGDLVTDLHFEGPRTFIRFNAPAREQLWYFESLAELVRPAIPEPLAFSIDELVAELRRAVATDPHADVEPSTEQ